MKLATVTALILTIWFITLSTATAQLPDDIRKLFDEQFVGQWTTDISFGESKQSGVASINWDAGGRSMINRWQNRDEKGVIHITELFGWDASSNHILVHGFDSRGNSWTIHWNRPTSDKPKELTGRGSGTAEGKKWESSTKIQFLKDAYRYEDTTDGKPFVLNARRMGSGEHTYKTWFNYLEGNWKCEEGEGNVGTVTFRKAGSAPGLVFQVELRDYSIVGVMGWDSQSKMVVETDYYGDRNGVVGTMHRAYSDISREILKGQDEFHFTSGITGNGAIECRRINDDEMTLTGVDHLGSKWTASFKRAR